MRKNFFIALCFSLAVILVGTGAPVFAMDGDVAGEVGEVGGTSGSGSTGDGHSGQDMDHQGINSGRDFAQHVQDHNDNFSGTHNPGVHHEGYSGIKD